MINYTPFVSFCMSTYKRSEMLKHQVGQLLLQDYDNFEIIISDNDPECSGRGIVNYFNTDKIKYFSNGGNIGMVESFNMSIKRSVGDFIVMITDDDPLYHFMLKELVALVWKYPNYGVYSGRGDWVIKNEFASETLQMEMGTKEVKSSAYKEDEISIVSGSDFPLVYMNGGLSKTFMLWSTMIVRREVVLSVGGMPNYGSEFLTDHAFVIAVGSKQGVVFLNKSLGAQVVHGSNFGYNFSAIKEKYIKTPFLFHDYLIIHLKGFSNWDKIDTALWNFAGRAFVEYSLMIFNSTKINSYERREFLHYLNILFSGRAIRKWKYKFYLKAYARPLFNILLKVKSIF